MLAYGLVRRSGEHFDNIGWCAVLPTIERDERSVLSTYLTANLIKERFTRSSQAFFFVYPQSALLRKSTPFERYRIHES